jgi:hypothetical protein
LKQTEEELIIEKKARAIGNQMIRETRVEEMFRRAEMIIANEKKQADQNIRSAHAGCPVTGSSRKCVISPHGNVKLLPLH